MPGKGLELNTPPAEAGEQREVRPAVEGQGSAAPAPAPPHEVAGFPVQPTMLGGRDLVGRARDQRGQLLAGESTGLDAKALGLRVELRPVPESCGRRVKEPQQAPGGCVLRAHPPQHIMSAEASSLGCRATVPKEVAVPCRTHGLSLCSSPFRPFPADLPEEVVASLFSPARLSP